MNTKPLTAIDETELISKYRKFILRTVFEFRVKLQISQDHPCFEDLLVEAQLAFIDGCRRLNVDSYDLSALQHASVKDRMRSAMRTYFWYANNMGGYNNKKIDPGRSYVFSDFERDDGTSIETHAPSYSIDDTELDLQAFLKSLPEKLQSAFRYFAAGHTDQYIADKMHVSPRTIGKWRVATGKSYLNYLTA